MFRNGATRQHRLQGNDSGYYGMSFVIVMERLTWKDIGDNIKMQREGPASVSFGEMLSLN